MSSSADPELVPDGERDAELTAAPVDHEEVRKVAFLAPRGEPPLQDVPHAREVVTGCVAADAVAPIARLVGPTLVDCDHRSDGGTALERRDVDALDALRGAPQIESAAQLLGRVGEPVALVPPLGEGLSRVRPRHLDEPSPLTAHRDQDLHLPAAALPEKLGPGRRVLDRERQQDAVGHCSPALVELRQHRAQDLLVGQVPVRELERLVRDELPAADHQDLHLDEPAFAVEPEDVLVDTAVRHGLLGLRGPADRRDLIPQPRRVLEPERSDAAFIRSSSIRSSCRSLPSSKSATARRCSPYSSRETGSTHGPEAAMDLVLEAGRVRLRKTASLHVRSGKTFRMMSRCPAPMTPSGRDRSTGSRP
jgi:hypothetical protein